MYVGTMSCLSPELVIHTVSEYLFAHASFVKETHFGNYCHFLLRVKSENQNKYIVMLQPADRLKTLPFLVS